MNKMKIFRIQIATILKLDKRIVLTCGEKLKKLEKDINGKLQLINIPDFAPPDAPRAMIKNVDTLINLSLNRLDIIITPPHHILSDIKSSLNYVKNRSESILSTLNVDELGYEWSGCIAICEYPKPEGETGAKSVTPVFDSLIKIDRNKCELSSFQLNFGFIEESISRNFRIAGYEKKQIKLTNIKEAQSFLINLSEIPSQEVGIQITIDLNNKINKKIGSLQDIDQLIVRMEKELNILPETLKLEGILT
jgi:hypothetical protein